MKPKGKKISIIIISVVMVLNAVLALTSCTGMGMFGNDQDGSEDQGIEVFRLEKGDMQQITTTTGSVDSKTQNNYTMQVSGEIISAMEKGDSFKEGDILVKVDNSDTMDLLEKADIDLQNSESSLRIARINYQSALDSNHIAIQLAETNTKKAEESSASAYKSLENANESARQAYESAETSLGNTENTASLNITRAKSALDEAERILVVATADPATTAAELAQYEYNIKTAQENYELTIAQQQSSIDSAEGSVESADNKNSTSQSSAQSSYEQSVLSQSTTYWSNLSSTQSAEAQIATTAENIKQAGLKVKTAKIELEAAEESLQDYNLIAPYNGIVLSSDFRAGEQAAGSSVISLISDEFIAKVTVSENDISKISEGNEALVTLDAYSDLEFTGSVIKIIPISTDDSGIISFEVLIEFETEEDIDLYYGLSANASIVTWKAEDVLYVPIQSVYKEDGKSYVDLLISDQQVDTENLSQAVKKVEVTTGINDYLYIEVTSGLKEGDIIVTSRIQ